MALDRQATFAAISTITTRLPLRSGMYRVDESGTAKVLAPALHHGEQMNQSRDHASAPWTPVANSSHMGLSLPGLGHRTPANLSNLPCALAELTGQGEILPGMRRSQIKAQETPHTPIAEGDRAAKAPLVRQLRASRGLFVDSTGMRWNYCAAWVTQRFDIRR